ncbi:hypothetical protein KY348_02400 [Candidatus Woesearchaeota archaeon]|nr:hypothetical protein [Candidatus Woesearchaeota archaeon]
MNNLKEIIDKIIRDAFPELMSEDIKIEYKSLNDALLECGSLTGEGFYIEVDTTLENAPVEVKEGGLAHELAHVSKDRDKRLISKLRDRFASFISKRYKTLDERNTDLEVIIRGYGPQLLSFLEYSEKKGFPHYKEDGLAIREVKSLL